MKLKSYNFNRRELILLALMAITLVMVLFYKVVWERQWPAYQQLKNQVQTTQERLDRARDMITVLPDRAHKAEQARTDWQRLIVERGFTLRGLADFVAAVQPGDEAVQVLVFRQEPAENRGLFGFTSWTIKVTGPYQAVVAYIEQLEALPVLAAIHSLKITSRADGRVEAGFIIDLFNLDDTMTVRE